MTSWFEPRSGGRLVRACLLLLLALSLGSTGCASVRDFLIPPPGPARKLARATTTPSLRLESVTLPDASTASTVVIGGGRLLEVTPVANGGDRPQAAVRVTRPGMRLEPSWTDAHVHLSGAALLQDAVVLKGAAGRDVRAFGELVAPRVAAIRPGSWVWCLGAQPALLGALDQDKLAQLVGVAPVWISAADGHGALLSPGAVQLLPKALAEQIHGNHGRIDGALARHAWRSLPLSPGRTMALMLTLLRTYAAAGVGEIHAMGESVAVLRMLALLAKQRRLPIRVVVYLDADDPAVEELFQRVAAGKPIDEGIDLGHDPRARLQLAGLKVWLDGSLGARTASLRSPYGDAPTSGNAEASDDDLAKAVARSDAAGLQLAVHAVGDAAVERLLRVVQAAQRPANALPVRIEHAQVVAPDQLARLRGMICSIQPLHRADDAPFAAARLGVDRLPWAYRAASLQPTCPLLAGSDLPIGRSDVGALMLELQGEGPAGRAETERLDPKAAADALRRQPRDGRVRTVAVGEVADLRLLDGDKLVALIVGGEITWRSGERL